MTLSPPPPPPPLTLSHPPPPPLHPPPPSLLSQIYRVDPITNRPIEVVLSDLSSPAPPPPGVIGDLGARSEGTTSQNSSQDPPKYEAKATRKGKVKVQPQGSPQRMTYRAVNPTVSPLLLLLLLPQPPQSLGGGGAVGKMGRRYASLPPHSHIGSWLDGLILPPIPPFPVSCLFKQTHPPRSDPSDHSSTTGISGDGGGNPLRPHGQGNHYYLNARRQHQATQTSSPPPPPPPTAPPPKYQIRFVPAEPCPPCYRVGCPM